MELMGSPKKGKSGLWTFWSKKAKKLKRDISKKVNSMEDGLFGIIKANVTQELK